MSKNTKKKDLLESYILPTWVELRYLPGGPNNRSYYRQDITYLTVMYVEAVRSTSQSNDSYIEEGDRAYGWIYASIYDPANHPQLKDTPWDFNAQFYMEDCKKQKTWVKEWVAFDSVRIIDDPQNEKLWCDIIKSFDTKSHIYRIADDYKVNYGDGGEKALIYPIWKCDQLPISEATREQFTLNLHNLSEKRKDYQKDSPVEDIIDPDLAPFIREKSNWVEWRTEQLQRLVQKTDAYRTRRALDGLKKDIKSGYLDKISENVKLRTSYQWIPSEFSIDASGKVSINSRIHNLPPSPDNKALYNEIRKVFQAMVPMFAKLNLIKKDQETNLQVIVKAQSYNMKPGMTYAGRWHMEGQTENIVAAGVYYPYVGSELEGGNLKFRPSEAPQPFYEICTDYEVPITQGTAVVFSNTVPHRFRKITNNSDVTQRRTFINFFIVDPSQPIPSTKTILAADFVHKVLKLYVKRTLNKTLPSEIAWHIVSWIPGVWGSTSSAKSFRQRARQAMVEDKSGWGWIHWGNCGDVSFVPSITTWSSYDRSEGGNRLVATDSDSNKKSHADKNNNEDF